MITYIVLCAVGAGLLGGIVAYFWLPRLLEWLADRETP